MLPAMEGDAGDCRGRSSGQHCRRAGGQWMRTATRQLAVQGSAGAMEGREGKDGDGGTDEGRRY